MLTPIGQSSQEFAGLYLQNPEEEVERSRVRGKLLLNFASKFEDVFASTEVEQAPAWVRDHVENLKSEAAHRKAEALEIVLPGLHGQFEYLINQLPDPNSRIKTEFPVVASIVRLGQNDQLEMVAVAGNETNKKMDSTAHAEMEAIRGAQKVLGDKHLKSCYLLSTHEPCAMCAGAIMNVSAEGVVYAVEHKDVKGTHVAVAGKFKEFRTSGDSFNAKEFLHYHNIPVFGGYMRSETMHRLRRSPINWREHYDDPDTQYN